MRGGQPLRCQARPIVQRCQTRILACETIDGLSLCASATQTATPAADLPLFYVEKSLPPMISFYFSPMRSFTIGSIASAHNTYPRGLRCNKSGIISLEIVPSLFVNLSPMSR